MKRLRWYLRSLNLLLLWYGRDPWDLEDNERLRKVMDAHYAEKTW